MDDPPYYGSEHLLNFSTVYPDVWARELKEVGIEQVGPHCKKKYATTLYHRAKCGGFAMGYGAGEVKADATFGRPGASRLLKRRFAKKDALNRKWVAFAERHGYVETIPDRSVNPERGYPLFVSRSERGGVVPTTPLNYHIQGTAMWWTHRAMVKCQEQLEEWRRESRFDGRMVLQVHDELVFDFPKRGDPVAEMNGTALPKSSNLWRIRDLQKRMESCGDDIGVPTPVGVEYNRESWAEGTTL
jgi:hypothetical protein